MAVYLKKFETHTQYDTYINGSGAILPNVSICTTEGDVHYNPSSPVPPTPVETRVVAKFNVTDTSSPTKISDGTYGFSAIEIDGVEQPSVVTEYTFTTTGEHIVKYTLTDQTSIGERAFQDCTSLTSIVIPNSVTSIVIQAFYNCNSLTSINIPSGVTSIDIGVFDGCSSLTSIVIPNSVTSIRNQAFAFCTSLTNINIHDSITTIEDCAFYNCDSLNATARDAINEINPNAFTCD